MEEEVPQIARVHLPHGPPMQVCCPICGEVANDYWDNENISPCPHLAFYMLAIEGGDYEILYGSEAFRTRMQAEAFEHIDADKLAGYLHRIGYSDELVVLVIGFLGGCMGSGDMNYFTEPYGWDYSVRYIPPTPGNEDDDDEDQGLEDDESADM